MIVGLFDFRMREAISSRPLGSGCDGTPQLSGAHRLDTSFLLQHVDRKGDEDGSPGRIGRDLEGAAQDGRKFVGTLDLHAPFCHGCRHGDEVMAQHGIVEPHARILLSRRDDERRIGLKRAIERADRIAEPGGDMDVRDRDAAGGLRVEARSAHRDAFVQGHDVFDLRVGHETVQQRRLGRTGIAEDVTHAVRHEGFHQHTFVRALASPLAFLCVDGSGRRRYGSYTMPLCRSAAIAAGS